MDEDLVAFLRARLDEDEQVALSATLGPWRHDPGKHWRKPGTAWFEEAVFAGPTGPEATCVAGTGETGDRQSAADASHIARHDPARVLAEVAAKRRILAEIVPEIDELDRAVENEYWVSSDGPYPDLSPKLLSILALPYAVHPDYRPEWAPGM